MSDVDLARATEIIVAWIEAGVRTYVTVTNVHQVIEARDDAGYRAILAGAGLTVADGAPLVWLARRLGAQAIGRVTGRALMDAVSAALAGRRGAAFYYGGAPGVAEALARAMEGRYPGLRTAGALCPPFRPLRSEEAQSHAQAIDASGADIVWVGLGTPKQEQWMAEMRPRLAVPVLVGVGAAFDYHTGRLKEAPRWMQRAALEWLFRLYQEPRRLWWRYARTVPRFLLLAARERLRRREAPSGR